MLVWCRVKNWLGRDRMWFLSALAAYGSAEFAVRIVRVIAVIVIARMVTPGLMGLAALVLSLFELIRVLANAGIGQKIILAASNNLEATCNTARRLFWIWCIFVGGIQLLVAAALHIYFDQTATAQMLAILSAVFLFMPGGLVQVFLLMRAGRMAVTARIAALQTIADHILTMILVIIWPSAWAIVLPKLLTAPIWLIAVRRARPWKQNAEHGAVPVRNFLNLSLNILGSEVLTAIRLHADKLIVGSVLGVKALGIYYFAFNAGLGIMMSITTAFSSILFPYLCGAQNERERLFRYRSASQLAGIILIPAVVFQCLLAPYYVPLIFGEQWRDSAPLVGILALAAIPILFGSANTSWLRATGRASTDLVIMILVTIATLAYLAIGAQVSLQAAIIGYAVGLAVNFIPISILIYRHAHQQLGSIKPLQKESLI